MSDGGDGFEVHPGDPWHPGWSDDAVGEGAPPTSGPRKPKERKRRWLRRKPEPPRDVTAEEDVAYSEPLVDPQARFRPAVPLVPESGARSTAPSADTDQSDEQAELELPAWVGEATLGAEVESAGFEPVVPADPVVPPAAESASEPQPTAAPPITAPTGEEVSAADDVTAEQPPIPPPGDASAAQEASAADDVTAEQPAIPPPGDASAAQEASAADDVTAEQPAIPPPVIAGAAEPPASPPDPVTEEVSDDDPFDNVRRLEELEAASREAAPQPDPSEAVASSTPYGVAGKEAFAVLSADDAGDDLEDWAAFAGSPDGDPNAASISPAVAPGTSADTASDEEPVEEEGKRRGIWPFRRRRRPDFEAEGEYPAIEDVWPEEDVLGPGARSVPDSRTAPVETPRLWDTEPGDEAVPEAVADEIAEAPGDWDDAPTATTPAPSGLEPESADEELVESLAAMEDDGAPTVEPGWDDGDDTEVGDEWRLAFDDGTAEEGFVPSYAPRPAGSTGGDEDAWGSDEDWDNEATVEIADPGLRHGDDVYEMAGTVEHRGLAEEMFRLGEEDTEWQAMTAAMSGVESGVVGFEDVADLTTGDQYEEGPRSDLGARVGVGLLLIVFLVGTMFVGGAAMAVFVAAMALLGTWEFFGTLRRLEFQPLAMIGYLGSLGILAAVWFHGPIAIPIGLALLVVLVYFVYAFSPMRQDALANGGLTVLAVAWVAGCVAFATPILRLDDFRALVAALVVATVAMDVGAYSFGRTFGSRALAPQVSPNKSVEGLLGGVLVTIGAGVGFGLLVEPFDLVSGIALGAVVAVMAPLGDLAESMVKRSLGVKDMGTLLPGHGGVLDRIDGFLFVIPAVFVLYWITGFLG